MERESAGTSVRTPFVPYRSRNVQALTLGSDVFLEGFADRRVAALFEVERDVLRHCPACAARITCLHSFRSLRSLQHALGQKVSIAGGVLAENQRTFGREPTQCCCHVWRFGVRQEPDRLQWPRLARPEYREFAHLALCQLIEWLSK